MDRRSLLRAEDEEEDIAMSGGDMGLGLDEIEAKESYSQNCSPFSTKFWLLASLAVNLGVTALLLVHIVPHKSNSTVFNGQAISTHFKARTEYMSLDHSYDIFWEELLINKSHWPALSFGKDHDKWLGRATITMLVLLQARLFYWNR